MNDKIKKIAISEATLQKMNKEMLEHLQENEDVQIIVMDNDEIRKHKLAAYYIRILICGMAGGQTPEEIELIKEKGEKLFEMKSISELPKIEDFFVPQKKRQKPYVPRTIGHPCTRKKGGR